MTIDKKYIILVFNKIYIFNNIFIICKYWKKNKTLNIVLFVCLNNFFKSNSYNYTVIKCVQVERYIMFFA